MFLGKLPIHKSVALFLFILLLSACNAPLDDPNPNKAQLEVYVAGTLGNPKNDAHVSIHYTEDDARNNVNPVVKARYTNSDGIVNFVNIAPGVSYWVRAKPLIYPAAFTETNVLEMGKNYLEIVTL